MNKPFMVANVRAALDKFDNEEVSFSRFVEDLNDIAFDWFSREMVKELEKDIEVDDNCIVAASVAIKSLKKQSNAR